jgi:hypothetical protein
MRRDQTKVSDLGVLKHSPTKLEFRCVRCTSTGRECDGYAELPPSKSKLPRSWKSRSKGASLLNPEKQFPVFTGSVLEQRALEFFFHRTAPQLSGFFNSRFWSGSVLQMSLSEPTIRYAMIAVSAMYEDESLNGTSPMAGTESFTTFALESYNKAIQSLIKSAKANPDSVRVPVMAAIIFICLEFLRGNVGTAITHIESGIKMLRGWRKKHCNGRGPFAQSSIPAEAAFIERELVPIFSCLNMLSSLFGRQSLTIYTNSLDAGDSFESPPPAISIAIARVELTDLVNVIVKFIRSIGESKYKSDISTNLIVEQTRLQGLFSKWQANYLQLLEKQATTQTEHDKLGANLIHAISITLKLWLAAALAPNETAWDQYKEDYEKIVSLSRTLVPEVDSSSKHSKHFSFEMGIIAPLHFVAWKCRWPHVRRKALALLKASPRRECLFESYDSCAVFTRVMLVEEECLGLPGHEVPAENELPTEESRIHQVDIAAAAPTSEGNPINFLSKPFGISGPWHSRTEYVQLGKVEFEDGLTSTLCISLEEKDDAAVKAEFNSCDPDYSSNLSLDPQTGCQYTGLSVNQADTLMSVGQFHPNEILERDSGQRKIIFASKRIRGLHQDHTGFGSSEFMEGSPTRIKIAAGGLLKWRESSW